jgi:hypothetical protein
VHGGLENDGDIRIVVGDLLFQQLLCHSFPLFSPT